MRTHPSPPSPTGAAEKVRLDKARDDLTKKEEYQRLIFSSNLSTHVASHSVENGPEVVDYFNCVHVIVICRDQSIVVIR